MIHLLLLFFNTSCCKNQKCCCYKILGNVIQEFFPLSNIVVGRLYTSCYIFNCRPKLFLGKPKLEKYSIFEILDGTLNFLETSSMMYYLGR